MAFPSGRVLSKYIKCTVYLVKKGEERERNTHYLQQEFKYGVVTVKSEEFGNSLRVQDFEGSILTKKSRETKSGLV